MSSQTVDDAVAVQRAVEEASAAIDHQEIVRVAHAMRHDISHESVSKLKKKKRNKLNQPQSHNK